MAIMKYCAPCRIEKPTSEFFAHRKTYDGLAGVCKKCYRNRYGRNAVKQRDIPLKQRDPLDLKFSKESNAIRFLERMLFIYGADTYCIDKTIQNIADDLDMHYRTVHRYLYLLTDMKLLRRTYCNNKDKSMGYKWWVCMNKPE